MGCVKERIRGLSYSCRCVHSHQPLASGAKVLNKCARAPTQIRQKVIPRPFHSTVLLLSSNNIYFPVVCTKYKGIKETFSSLWPAKRFRGSRRPQTSSRAETFQAKMRYRSRWASFQLKTEEKKKTPQLYLNDVTLLN